MPFSKLFTFFLCFFLMHFFHVSQAWGPIGHRVVGQIASEYLNMKSAAEVKRILGNETLAEVSTYMDFIRSDKQFDYLSPWHYATIPDNEKYAGPPKEGDIIEALLFFTGQLQSDTCSLDQEAFALKCLVHLVGDIHQPLHIGNGQDRGGNDTRVEYFWESTNLHRVWDSGIIENQKFSYTEYTNWINHPQKNEIEEWQSDELMKWAYESMSYRAQVYDLPENGKISYDYDFKNLAIVNKRLLQAGIRLAGLLNQIYE